jgi:methyl-accepting chemotaxis protein
MYPTWVCICATRVGNPCRSDRCCTNDWSMPDQNGERMTEDLDEITAEHADLLSVLGSELSESREVIESLSQNAATANQASTESARRADTARTSAHEAHDDVVEARAAAHAAREQLETLQETVSRIDDFTAVLNDIAEQTNMLALNASIEAANVGQDGDGFAVVADEVKTLAENAQEQATEIESIVDEVQTDADETIERIEIVDRKTDTAAESITETTDDLDAIAGSAQETSESVDRVAETTQTFADDINGLASKMIDAISQAKELEDRVG